MIVAGNWKMNLSVNEAIELSNELLKHNNGVALFSGSITGFMVKIIIPLTFYV